MSPVKGHQVLVFGMIWWLEVENTLLARSSTKKSFRKVLCRGRVTCTIMVYLDNLLVEAMVLRKWYLILYNKTWKQNLIHTTNYTTPCFAGRRLFLHLAFAFYILALLFMRSGAYLLINLREQAKVLLNLLELFLLCLLLNLCLIIV